MKKRLFAVALTALTPAVGMLAYNEFQTRVDRNAEVHRQAAQLAREAASEMGSVIEGVKGLLVATAAVSSIAQRDPHSCNIVLKSVAAKLATIRNILVLDKQGRLVCDSMGWAPGTDFGDREYVQRALKTDGLVIGQYTLARGSKAPILPVAVALKEGGETVGVLATGVRLEWLQERLLARGLTPGGSVTIADRTGVILARNPDPSKFVGTTIPTPYQFLLSAPSPGTIELVSQDRTKRIIGYVPVSHNNPLYVSAGLSEALAFEPINRASVTGLVMMVVGAFLALYAAVFVGNRFILDPINHIVSVLKRWRGGELDARTWMKGRYGEVGQVGASVDSLLDELEVRRCESARAEEQRTLMARELSHRVKNTMAVVQAIARQTFKGRSAENAIFGERIGALANAFDVLRSDDWKSADMRAVVVRALAPLGGEGVDQIVVSGPPCVLDPDAATAISLVIHELATNALKYGSLSQPSGRLDVQWTLSNGRVDFQWSEQDGPPVVPPEDEGFGSKLIRGAFPARLKPQVRRDFAVDGLRFYLSFLSADAAKSARLADQGE